MLIFVSGLLLAPAVQARGKDRAVDPKADAVAREHVRKATEAFQAGRYDEALAQFEAGYAAVPRPGFILNMGHVARQAGYKARAHDHYRRYLELAPSSPQRAEVEKALAELDADRGQAAPDKPASGPKPAGVGAPRPAVKLAVAEDNEVPSDLKLTAREPVRPATDQPPAFYQRWWFWGAVAGVVAAGAVTFLVVRSGGDDYATSGTWGTLGR